MSQLLIQSHLRQTALTYFVSPSTLAFSFGPDLAALQVWAPAHSITASSPGVSTPVATVVLPPPGASTHTPSAAAGAAAIAGAAPGTVTPSSMTTAGSAGPYALPVMVNPHGAAAGGGLCSTSTGTTPLPPYPHTRNAISHSLGAGDEALQTLTAYVQAEARPAEKMPTADVVWGQTERERV